MDPYKKEIKGTVFFFIMYLLICHTGVWALILGIDTDVRILGFPAHYFIAIVLGWFGVLVVSVWWNIWADRLEAEIRGSDSDNTGTSSVTGGQA
jgi:hypothetical protein